MYSCTDRSAFGWQHTVFWFLYTLVKNIRGPFVGEGIRVRCASVKVCVARGKLHAWGTLGFWVKSCHFFLPRSKTFLRGRSHCCLGRLIFGRQSALATRGGGGRVYNQEPSLGATSQSSTGDGAGVWLQTSKFANCSGLGQGVPSQAAGWNSPDFETQSLSNQI